MRSGMHKWHLFRRTIFVLVAALGMAVAATFLPDNPYERFQLLDSTIYNRARWSYERMHFDPRPIDVAIVGDSKAALGLSASEIERRLATTGKPASVVNMALEGDGRNQQWIFVQELLRTKQPKVIVLAINDQPYPWGHDSFRYIAPASEIWREAFHGLHDTKKNLMFLPFRQLKLFAAIGLPGPFGLRAHFDPLHDAEQSGDPTKPHKNRAGEQIDFSQTSPRPVLMKQVADNAAEFGRHSRLPPAVRAVTDADDHVYTDLIARAAARRGVKLLFVYQPAFHRPAPIANRPYYEALGQVQDNSDLAEQDMLFYDWVHLNTAGAMILSDRVADNLAKMLP
jgi:hypothetical protein